MEPASASLRTKRLLWLLLLGSLALKIILILVHGSVYDYHSDDRGYLNSARVLYETSRFTYIDPAKPAFFVMPGLPAMLAGLMHLTGPGPALEQTFRIVQAVMVTASLWLLFRIGVRLFSERKALLAVALCAVYPPLWLVSAFIFTEASFMLALMMMMDIALRSEEKPTWRRAFALGLVWAAAVYIRPTIALWPGLFFLLLLYRRRIAWRRLIRMGLITAAVFVLCLLPWWVRNYEASGGHFIPLTKASGNPLLLGTYPWTVPALFMEEQKTWHTGYDLWKNDDVDTRHAVERIKDGFRHSFWTYASWYLIGKPLLYWGDVFYWMPIPGVPLIFAILWHYLILIPGFLGMYRNRSRPGAVIIMLLLGYMTILHAIYLAHSRYSVPLMPLVALFAAAYLVDKRQARANRIQPTTQ